MSNNQIKLAVKMIIAVFILAIAPMRTFGSTPWQPLNRKSQTRGSISFPKSPTPAQSFYPTIRPSDSSSSTPSSRRNWVDMGNGTRIRFGDSTKFQGERIEPDVLKTLEEIKSKYKKPLYQLKTPEAQGGQAPITGAMSMGLESPSAEKENQHKAGMSKRKLTFPPGKNIRLQALDFRNTEVSNAIRSLAQLININIMLSPDITGRVNILFSDITLEEAFNTLLSSYDLSFSWEGTILRVFPSSGAPVMTLVFSLSNTDPSDIKPKVDSILTPSKGKCEIDVRTNSLVVTDTEAKLSEIRNFLPQIDIKVSAVDISTRPVTEVFYLDYADATNLEPPIKMLSDKAQLQAFSSSQASQAGAAGGAATGGRMDMMIITDTQNNLDRIHELIEKLDIPPVQITIDARIYEIDLNKERQLGINWQKQIPMPGTGENAFSMTVAPEAADAGGIGVFRFGSLDVNQFTALLAVLSTRNFAKVLSNPVITTLNNRPANITVGQAIPYVSASTVNAQTGQVSNTVSQVDANITLDVTPSVTGNDEVFMDINPTISSVLGFTSLGGNSTPNISNRTAKTQVICKDNHTIVIGGMIKTDKSNTISKVPLLGDLPGIGKLFQKTTEREVRTELIIFITPHIVRRDANRLKNKSNGYSGYGGPKLTLQP